MMTDREIAELLGLLKDCELAVTLKLVAALSPEKRALFERMKDFQILENAGLLKGYPKR